MLFRLQLDTNRSEASLFVNGSRLELMFTDLPSDQVRWSTRTLLRFRRANFTFFLARIFAGVPSHRV